MSAQIRSAALLVAAIALVAAAAAGAQADSPGRPRDFDPEPRLELFLSSLYSNGSSTDGSFGLRGARFLKRRFALEGSLSRVADGRVDLWLVDVSAKLYLRDRGRTGIYVLGGPGLFHSNDLDADEVIVHLGIGAEFALGRRFYIRPELRERWFAENLDAVNISTFSLGFGWKL